jgi:hypothetical protein
VAQRPEGRVAIRSYRGVLDEVERRIFRLDRWRLPTPHGVPVRSVGYALVCLIAVIAASSLPLVGPLLGLLPDSLRLAAVPALCGWALATLRLDGRPPHRALASAARYLTMPRSLSGLRPCPAVGSELAPLKAVELAAVGDGSELRAGRLRGPARVTLRYPARAVLGGARFRSGEPRGRLAAARRITLTVAPRGRRPLGRARTLKVPAGGEVRVR